MTIIITTCIVCAETVEPHTEAFCGQCGALYHLNQRADRPGKDCGQVWINEEHLALEFACDSCLNPSPPQANLDDILDLDEAAVAAGTSASSLAAAADRGELRHRKTSGGVYLFERRDLAAFAER